MIRLDPRVGSGELLKYFKPFGVNVELTQLRFGDFDWEGNGPGNAKVMVTVERKRITDLMDSMKSRRLSGHQLPGITDNYDYGYLVVEGIWKVNEEDGGVLVHTGRDTWQKANMNYRMICNYLMGLQLRAGMLIWRTGGAQETVEFVVGQYRMWTEKRWEEHKSHDQTYAPATPLRGHRLSMRVREPNQVEKMAMQLPGVDSLARVVAKRFATVWDMALATETDWMGIDGIGKKKAEAIVKAIRG